MKKVFLNIVTYHREVHLESTRYKMKEYIFPQKPHERLHSQRVGEHRMLGSFLYSVSMKNCNHMPSGTDQQIQIFIVSLAPGVERSTGESSSSEHVRLSPSSESLQKNVSSKCGGLSAPGPSPRGN